MKKKLKIITKILMFLVLMNTSLGSTSAYADSDTPTYTPFEDKEAGDIVKFGGREWIILEPETGFIILSSKYADYRPLDPNYGVPVPEGINEEEIEKARGYFDKPEEMVKYGDGGGVVTEPEIEGYTNYKNSGIRTYLNGEFLNKLGKDKFLIQNWTWNCGGMTLDEADDESWEKWKTIEKTIPVTDEVGLLTVSEYKKYGGSFISTNEKYNWWLITTTRNPEPYNNPFFYWSGDLSNSIPPHGIDIGVRPALHLKSGLYVSDDDEIVEFVTTEDIQDATIKLVDLSEEVKNGIGPDTAITVVKDQAFDIVIIGYDSIGNGEKNSEETVKVVHSDTSDGYIRLSGTLSTVGVQKITIDGQEFIFNVINPPSAGTVTAEFN